MKSHPMRPRGGQARVAQLAFALHEACGRGLALGGVLGGCLAAALGVPPATSLLGAAGGGALGALIGLLLWSGSDAWLDDPVVPPQED